MAGPLGRAGAMCRVRLAVVVVVLGLSALAGCRAKAPRPDDLPRLVPVGTVAEPPAVVDRPYGCQVRVTVRLDNPSAGPLRVRRAEPTGLEGLTLRVFRDGQELREEHPLECGNSLRDRAKLLAESAKFETIPAGRSTLLAVGLEWSGLTPGQYEVRMRYSIPRDSPLVTRHELTPADLEARCILNIYR